MEEYKFQVTGREELLIATGTGESGMFCWCPHYNDRRVNEIKEMIKKFNGKITSIGDLFTPIAGKRYTLEFDVSFNSKKLKSFENELRTNKYNSLYKKLTEEEINQREEIKKQAKQSLKIAQGYF